MNWTRTPFPPLSGSCQNKLDNYPATTLLLAQTSIQTSPISNFNNIFKNSPLPYSIWPLSINLPNSDLKSTKKQYIMESSLREREKEMELWCITVDKDMTVSGMLIKDMGKASKYLPMEVCMRASTFKIKCKVRESIFT